MYESLLIFGISDLQHQLQYSIEGINKPFPNPPPGKSLENTKGQARTILSEISCNIDLLSIARPDLTRRGIVVLGSGLLCLSHLLARGSLHRVQLNRRGPVCLALQERVTASTSAAVAGCLSENRARGVRGRRLAALGSAVNIVFGVSRPNVKMVDPEAMNLGRASADVRVYSYMRQWVSSCDSDTVSVRVMRGFA